MSPQFWPPVKARGFATAQTSSAGWLGAGWGDVPGLSLSQTLESGGAFLVLATIQAYSADNVRKASVRITVDGSAVTTETGLHLGGTGWYAMGFAMFFAVLSPGAHTFKVQGYGSGAGVVTLNGSTLAVIPA